MVQVVAVVLTFNRQALLKRCLEALFSQSRRPDRIIVVDNASTDETPAMLKSYEPGVLEVCQLPSNVGAAGGFHRAMQLGRETRSDFVWVMDDDVIPAPDALAELLDAYELLDEQRIAAPFVVSCARDPQGHMTNVPEVDLRHNALAYENWPHLLAHGLVPVTRSTFVSALFRRETLDHYGLPIAAMYMWGEDTEYTRRVTCDVPGYMVGRSHVEHVRAVSGMLDIRTENDPARVNLHRLLIRNRVYMERRYRGRRAAIRYATKMAKVALKLLASRQTNKAQVILQGILHGFAFNPVVEANLREVVVTSAPEASLAPSYRA